jgi:anti-anti-sigma regulatory factor
MTDHRYFEVQRIDGVCVIRVSRADMFDMLNVRGFEQELLSFIDQEQPAKLVVNFNSVKSSSTEMINNMLKAKRRLLKHNGALKLCGINETVREVYKVLNMDGTVFEIYERCSDAIQAFQGT